MMRLISPPALAGRTALALACASTGILMAAAAPARAQDSAVAAAPPSFYDHRAPLHVTLTANFNRLRRDRQEDPPWRAGTLSFADTAGNVDTLQVRVRTRGIWRRNNCQMPPLRIDFVREAVVATPFAGINRPKLVNFCQDQDRAEQYVLQEMQLYRVYELLAPISHRVRLLRITYADSGSGKVRTTRYGFFLEEPQALAARVGAEEVEIKGLVSDDLDPYARAVLGVFQYFIGNTDWSTAGLHNVELFGRGNVIYPVAYDFDYSGAVNAHYAVPPPQVRIRRVTERAFRGACAPEATFTAVFDAFRGNKAAIYGLYEDEIGRYVERPVAQRTLRFFDDFYAVIDDSAAVRRQIFEKCASSQ